MDIQILRTRWERTMRTLKYRSVMRLVLILMRIRGVRAQEALPARFEDGMLVSHGGVCAVG